MANQIIIDIGAVANDGTGDPLRTAFGYVNDNFSNVWATGVANSNVAFDGNKILTVNTNGNLVLAPNGTGKVVANVDIVPNTANTRNLGALNNRWSTVYAQYLNVSGNVDFGGNIDLSGDLTVDGNLTVNGTTTTINTANVDIEDKVVTIAYGSPNAAVANGSGITIAGANASIIWSNTAGWTMNTPLEVSGNVTANYFFGNASQMSGLPVPYTDANVSTYLASGNNTSNIVTSGNINGSYINGNAIGLTSLPAAGGPGELQFNANGVIGAAGLTYIANNRTLYGVTASFVGQDANTGINALYAGVESFTVLGSAVMAQFTGNVTSYSQLNFQNASNSVTASGDYIITADNGTDSTHFVNLGMTSSNWDGTQPNSLGNRVGPNDGYLYVQDGNLVIGTSDGIVNTWKFGVDGNVTASGNLIPSATNTYSLGNSTNQWSDLYVSNATIYMNNVPVGLTAGNVLTVDGQPLLSNDSNTSISTTGNITATEFFGNIAAANVVGTVANATYADLSASAISVPAANVTGLSNVATSGSYSDLTGTPTIPTATSNLTNDSGFITSAAIPANVSAFNNDSGYITTATANVISVNGQSGVVTLSIPTATSNLTNDSGYITTATANVISVNGQSGVVTLSIPTATSNLTNDSGYITTGNLGSLTSNVTTTANISGGYILGNGSQLTGLPASYTDANVTTLLASLGSNTISGTGNITTTANISGQYVLGNAAFMTGIPASYGNANVADFLDSLGSNAIVTTGNISGGNLLASGYANITGNINGSGATFSGNVTAANFSGNISITGNVTGTSPNVSLVAGSYTWTFNNAGNLVLPGNTFAVNYANGTQVSLGGAGTYGDSNVATLLSAFGSNTISTTGTVTTGTLIGTNNLVVNAPSPTAEGGQLTLAWANTSGLTGQGNSTWNLDVDGSSNVRLFYQNATSATGVLLQGNVTGNSINFPGSGGISVTGNATVDGVGSNLTRRASFIGAANTAVTLDNFEARLGGSPVRLYINTVSGNATLTGTSQTYYSGGVNGSQWVNVPVGAGAANAFAMSGAVSPSTGGEMVILNFCDQISGTFMYRVTAIVANTTSGNNAVTIERLA